MVYIVLYLVGAILAVNGLTMAQTITAFNPIAGQANVPVLGLAFSATGIGMLNLVIGGLIVVMALIIATKGLYDGFGETVSSVVAATCLTFAIAYVSLGAGIYAMYNPNNAALASSVVSEGAAANPFVAFAALQPLGWYCFPMSIMLFIISLGFFNAVGKKLPKVPQFGVLWLLWAITFFLFFYVLGLGNYGAGLSLLKMTGWWTLGVGVVSCAYPALGYFNAGKVGAW
ncbi:MAG: AmiS/UreI family transporter [Thermodesulfobacteriota bacterium]